MFISFSGLDGSGKTTLIQALKRALEARDRRVTVLTVYDDIAFYARLRALRDRVRGGRPASFGNGSGRTQAQERLRLGFVGDPRTDVSDKTGCVTRLVYRVARSLAVRRAVLLLDLASLLLHRLYVEKAKGRVLITDRYLYDSLVDVMDQGGRQRGFVRWFTRLVPTPDAPVFVDVPAEQAFARKAEYPLDYMRWRRTAYQQVFSWVRRPIIIENRDLDAAVTALTGAVVERLEQTRG